ncbi:MAG: hypothetical protein HC902_08410, partial [Calothrix sp. SM1_5_4]|nr:hypothetical protein [Calothrix sp. SM1_5_4]
DAHLRLTPLSANPKTFAEPARKQEVHMLLREFARAASSIARDDKAPNADPLIEHSAEMFFQEARQALSAYETGDIPWARYSIHRSTGYCISCHTRADRGAKDFTLQWEPKLSALDPAQRIEFLLANRQYSSALARAKELAVDVEFVKKDPRAWIVAIEKVMAMLFGRE